MTAVTHSAFSVSNNDQAVSVRPSSRWVDAVVIGAGPAGASCATWLARLGFSVEVFDADSAVGGLCRHNPFRDDWNVSLPGMTGPQVADNFAASLSQAGVPVHVSCPISRVRPIDGGFQIEGPALDAPVYGRHVVVATGVRARGLKDMSGAEYPSLSNVLVGPGQAVVDTVFTGRSVAVLGGGDNAFENALYAYDHGAANVHIFARTVRAQAQFRNKFPEKQVHVGPYQVNPEQGQVNGQSFDLIMVFYGWEPCAPFADALGLTRTEQGFIATDSRTAQTSFPGVYAVGEVAQRQHPCVVTAMADGVAAAKAIQGKLEAVTKGMSLA